MVDAPMAEQNDGPDQMQPPAPAPAAPPGVAGPQLVHHQQQQPQQQHPPILAAEAAAAMHGGGGNPPQQPPPPQQPQQAAAAAQPAAAVAPPIPVAQPAANHHHPHFHHQMFPIIPNGVAHGGVWMPLQPFPAYAHSRANCLGRQQHQGGGASSSGDRPPGLSNLVQPIGAQFSWVITEFAKQLDDQKKIKLYFPFPCVCGIVLGQGSNASHEQKFLVKITEQKSEDTNLEYVGMHLRFVRFPCWSEHMQQFLRHLEMAMEFTVQGPVAVCNRGSLHRFYKYGPEDMQGKRLHGWTKFILKSHLLDPSKGYLFNGGLSVKCEIRFRWSAGAPYLSSSQMPCVPYPSEEAASELHRSLVSAFHCDSYPADVTLEAMDGTQVKTSKFILCVRSEVFRAMFSADMQEKMTNVVKIEDADGETLRKFIEYLFTGNIDDVSRYAIGLLPLADKYNIAGLHSLCVHAITTNMRVDNVLPALGIAEQHDIVELKHACFRFIASHSAQVTSLVEWGEFSKHSPMLLGELVNHLASGGSIFPASASAAASKSDLSLFCGNCSKVV